MSTAWYAIGKPIICEQKKTLICDESVSKKILLFANRKPIICEQKNGFFRIKKFFYSMVRDRKTHYLRTKKPIICDESCLSYYLRTTKTPYLRIKKNPYLRTPCIMRAAIRTPPTPFSTFLLAKSQ